MKLRKRLHKHAEVDSEGSWAISYGDLVTLLLAFFIIFFAADKFQKDKKLVQLDIESKIRSDLRAVASESKETGVSPDNEMSERLRAKVYKVGSKLLIEFPNTSFFKSGDIHLTSNGRERLDSFYNSYASYMGHFQLSIRAFTDTKQVKFNKNGRYQDNLELSALRSIAVMRYMQTKGIPLDLMKLSGYGEMLLTMQQLDKLPKELRKPTSVDDLARTVMLVIEPKEGGQ